MGSLSRFGRLEVLSAIFLLLCFASDAFALEFQVTTGLYREAVDLKLDVRLDVLRQGSMMAGLVREREKTIKRNTAQDLSPSRRHRAQGTLFYAGLHATFRHHAKSASQ